MTTTIGRSVSATEEGGDGDGAGAFVMLDLGALRNSKGIASGPGERGGLNIWGNSFPAAHFPSGATVTAGGVPFRLPVAGPAADDNLRPAGQSLAVPAGHYDWIHVLATSERRSEEPLWLHFEGRRVDESALRISDFWAAEPQFGEVAVLTAPEMVYPGHVQPGVVPVLWAQRVPVQRRATLQAIRFPDAPALHVFAATLQVTVVGVA
jgi:hypothetical protein